MRRMSPIWRWLATLLVLAGLTLFIDLDKLWLELQRLPVVMLVPAAGLIASQVALSAWRWRYTAGRLGLHLPFWQACREYYLASFLNQVLPGGVVGDVGRAWRHSRQTVRTREAVHAVMIERLSGQCALLLLVVSALAWLSWSGQMSQGGGPDRLFLAPLVAVVVLGVGLIAVRFLMAGDSRVGHYLRNLVNDLSQSLLGWPVLPIQLATSLLVIASYLALFLLLASEAGYLPTWNSILLVTALCSLLLLSMVVPVTVAGWGVREGAAAVLWPLAGLPAEQGVALSVGYGALVLVASLPGLVVLWLDQVNSGGAVRKTRDQTAYHCPD